MKFKIADRINIAGFFPREMDLISGRIMKDIKKKVEISQEEIKESGLESISGGYRWKPEYTKEVDVTFTNLELKFLQERISEMSKTKKIPLELIDLALRIDEEKEIEIKENKK